MSVDTAVEGPWSEDSDSSEDSEPYRMNPSRMGSFGTSRYGLGAVMNAVVGLLRPRVVHPIENEEVVAFSEESLYESAEDMEVDYDDSSSETSYVSDMGPMTTNGAPCLHTTGKCNVDLFASPFIFFDGSKVAGNIDDAVSTFRDLLHMAYTEDPVLALNNILYMGNLRNGGTKNHPAHMVALTWLWDKHPDTFLSVVAPLIASNTCVRDILTLFCAITFNHNFPVSRLWSGEQPDASRDARRSTLRDEEQILWTNLLDEFGKKARDVVKAEPLRTRSIGPCASAEMSPAVLQRDDVMASSITPEASSPGTDAPDPSLEDDGKSASADTRFSWGTGRRPQPGAVLSNGYAGKKKNFWIDENFKVWWHSERAKLHSRDYGMSSGVAASSIHYQAFSEFVVNFFATSLAAGDKMAGKWAPTPGGAHDKATKGVKAFTLPESWGGTGGLSQAIAYRMYGHLLKPSEGDTVDNQKWFIMSKYNRQLSTLRKGWVPESLEGSKDTFTQTPDLTQVTGRWRSYKAARILKTPEQKADLVAFTEKVASGAKGFRVTSGAAKPHLLFKEACEPMPGSESMYGESKSVEELSIEEWDMARKTAVLQWEHMQKKVSKAVAGSDYEFLAVCDVSGSMIGTPMDVSIALGILLSFANDPSSPYFSTVLPFDSISIPIKLNAGCGANDDRFDRPTQLYEQLSGIPWGGSTNIDNVFEQAAKLEKTRLAASTGDISAKKKRLVLVIFSDMQFDAAVQPLKSGEKGSSMLKTEVLQRLCKKVGLEEVPLLVYWDVQSSTTTTYPAGMSTDNVVLLSGTSDGNFQSLLSADFTNVTPAGFMMQAFAKLPYEITQESILD